jgi:hypothetical protein
MKTVINKFITKKKGRGSARSSLFSAFLLLFVSILIFTITPVKADSFDVKPSCCSSSTEVSSDAVFSGKAILSESCPCCGGICRCNFNAGIPFNDTELNTSPRSSYHGDETYAVSESEYSDIEYNASVEWRAALLIDYGESAPLYLLKSSLLFYH